MREVLRRARAFVRTWVHVLLLACVLAAALGVRYRNIRVASPYCGHVDEQIWIEIAFRMMRTGDLNPSRFKKPSLPVYMMLAGSSVGLLSEARGGEVRDAKALGKSAYPFYQRPRAVESAKRLFAFLSVVALALLGVVARALTGSRASLWLAPLVAGLSTYYLKLSWTYMNVDIVGACFAWATICQLLLWYRREQASPGTNDGAVDPLLAGVLAGATIGCKYNLALILLPCLLTLALLGGQRVVARTALLLAVCAATFVLTTPYAVLDFAHFLKDVASEVLHYSKGHGTVIDKGWPMFAMYGAAFVEDWGVLLLVIAAAGHVRLCLRDARLFAVVASFPLALLGLMSLQSTFFFRNVLALHLFIALGVCAAFLALPELWRSISARFPRLAQRPRAAWVFGALVCLLVLSTLPWGALERGYVSEVSSRRAAARWLLRAVPTPSKVLVDERLNMDTSRVAALHQVQPFKANAKSAKLGRRLRSKNAGALVLAVESTESFYTELAKGATKLAEFGSELLVPGKKALGLDPKFVVLRLANDP
jgi:hypothetical protein